MEMTKVAFADTLVDSAPVDCRSCTGVQLRATRLTREVNAGTMLPDEAIEDMQRYVEPVEGEPCLGRAALGGCMSGVECRRWPFASAAN